MPRRHRPGAPATAATTTAPPNADDDVHDDDDYDCDCCLPLAVVEVVPLHMTPATLDGARADPGPPALSAPMVKMQLRTMTTASLVTRTRRGLNDDSLGDGGGEVVMRIAFDADDPNLGKNNAADEVSKGMESLSLGTTITSSEAAVSVQPATTRIISGNIFLSDPNWDDAVERQIIEAASGRADQLNDAAAPTTTQMPIIRILSDDPTDFSGGVPCWVRGYALITAATDASPNDNDDGDEPGNALDCAVMAGTLVRVLPAINARVVDESNGSHEEDDGEKDVAQGQLTTLFEGHFALKGGAPPLPLPLFTELSGEVDPYQMRLSRTRQEEIDFILACHDDEAVRGLLVRMQALLEREVLVGTTDDALALSETKRTRRRRRRGALQSHLLKSSSSAATDTASIRYASGFTANVATEATNSCSNLFRDGALTVHNPYELSGKTLLVETLARHVLKCSAVHILDSTTLFAQYGANGADVALESLLHSIVLSAAVGGGRLRPDHYADIDKKSVPSICIVLDHLETFVPPSMLDISGSGGDPRVPALNAIVAYLTKLTKSIQNRGHFPYPTKNPMYNIDGSLGFVIPVRVCIVGIVTSPDDGGRSGVDSMGDAYTILDVLGSNRYRLSQPSARTRHRAFCRAFEEANVQLSAEAKEVLPVIAASTTGARGRDFRKTAKELLSCVLEKKGEKTTKMREATVEDVRKAMKIVPRDAPSDSSIGVTFLSSKTGRSGASKGKDMFATVGGNTEAKLALEDALALDPKKRRILSAFGLSPPVGVLLYGPPGTGKTLLAKATALALESESPVGGAFINLQATDIVMGAVGQSEKLVVSSFELARQNTPAVIFIDEMETLFTERGGTGGSQLASTLLQCMDDVSRWRDADEKAKKQKAGDGSASIDGEDDIFDAGKGRIVVLGATNLPWRIDKAFLRPGRFDRVVHVGLPTQEERESILKVHVGNMEINIPDDDKDVAIAIVKDELCKQLARDTEGLSGADLFALCRAAAIRCIQDKAVEGGVKEIHFLEALEKDIEPSCDENFVHKLMNWSPRGRN